jgi:hypothetical protein
MINTTRKGSPQMQPLLIVLAAALRAPAEDLARRRLPTLSYRRAGKTSPTETRPTTMSTRPSSVAPS